MKAEDIIRTLRLEPHPEGGFYAETWRASEWVDKNHLPHRYSGARRYGTSIFFLLTRDTFSALHRLESDEIFHFHAGDPVELFQLSEDGCGAFHRLGMNLSAGERPQIVVPRGVWQGSRLVTGGQWCLMGTTVAPGFDFEDFRMGKRDELLARFPEWQEAIVSLTRS